MHIAATAPVLNLTKLMRWTLLILQELSTEGIAPSMREVGTELDLPASNVHRVLKALKARGRIEWRPGAARSLRVVAPIPFPPDFAEPWTISLAPNLRPDLRPAR